MISLFLHFLNDLPTDLILICLFGVSTFFLVLFAKFFGKAGLFVYSVLAIVLANIQVLKVVQFSFWSDPVALGTILFSSTFVVSDVLTDRFGAGVARQCVGLGFLASLMVTAVMLLTLGLQPIEASLSKGTTFLEAHRAMEVLFKPSVAIFGASLISYIASQFLDIHIFQKLKNRFPAWGLWRRSAISTALAFLLDNICFSVFAWVLFAESPVPLQTLIWTYILGTYVLRLGIALLSLPFVGLIRKMVK